jgi:type I restriction-modification system DNA methylase subunit
MNKKLIKKHEAGGEITVSDYQILRKLVNRSQYAVMRGSDEYNGDVARLMNIVNTMPKDRQSESVKANDKLIYLHYFYGSSDYYVAELDKDGDEYFVFGFAILNGDMINAEWGSSYVSELTEAGMELDLHWRIRTFGEIMDELKKSESQYTEQNEDEKDTSPILHEQNDRVEDVTNVQVASEVIVHSSDHETNTRAIRKLIDEKGEDRTKYTAHELDWIRTYEGLGGLSTKGFAEREILDQYFTPHIVIQKMWGLAIKYGFNPAESNMILEPACGIGRFMEYVPNPEKQIVDMYEIDRYSAIITKLSFPMYNVVNDSFETMFFMGKRYLGMMNVSKRYDLVISNPPYREFNSAFSHVANSEGDTEKSVTLASTFDQYFTMRSVDLLKSKGLLVTIVPNTFMNNAKNYNEFKELLASKADLLDAYRLPNNTFFNTAIGTDILVIKRK